MRSKLTSRVQGLRGAFTARTTKLLRPYILNYRLAFQPIRLHNGRTNFRERRESRKDGKVGPHYLRLPPATFLMLTR